MNKQALKLIGIARGFRKGFLNGRSSEQMCFVVSSSLAAYLRFEGYFCVEVRGLVGDSEHFWIAFSDGNILDATADQFSTPDGGTMPEVYYGAKPEWYQEAKQ